MKKLGLIAVALDGTLFDTVAVNAESYRRALESLARSGMIVTRDTPSA